jgi:hypothetical protein
LSTSSFAEIRPQHVYEIGSRLEFACPRCGKKIIGGAEISDRTKVDPAKRVALECHVQRGGCGWKGFKSQGDILSRSEQVEAVEDVG